MTTTISTNTFTVQTTVEVTPQRIADMMCTAIEGDMTSCWCVTVRLLGPGKKADWKTEDGYPWYCNAELFARDDFKVEFIEVIHEGDDWHDKSNQRSHVCGREEFAAGLKLMAEKHPQHFQDMINENDDAVTGDVFLQCVALKDVVYG